MREIASEASIGPSLLYRYYSTKDRLLHAVVSYIADQYHQCAEELREFENGGAPLPELTRSIARRVLELFVAMSDWHAFRFTAIPLEPEREERLQQEYDGVLAAIVDALRARGRWRDPEVATRVLCYTIQRFVLYQRLIGVKPMTEAATDAFLEDLIRLLLDAERGGD